MSRFLTFIGLLATAGYLWLVYWLAGTRLGALKTMELNAVGDFLAGAFGPLAILWLILGFLQQGIELRQNNEALRLQAEELKNAVEQQKELVSVTKNQFEYAIRQEELEKRPNIFIEAVSRGRDANGTRVEFIFTNNGYLADTFVAKFEVNDHSKVIVSTPALKSGAESVGQYTFMNIPNEIKISIQYKCGLGIERRQDFGWQVTERPMNLPSFKVVSLP